MLHNVIGDIMKEYDLWLLFKNTGKIDYYLKYKTLKKEKKDNDKEDRRNHY